MDLTNPECMLLREIEISYKITIPQIELIKLTTSFDTVKFLRQIWKADKMQMIEECKVLFLNQSIKVIGFTTLSIGGITGTVVDIRVLLGIALRCLATGIIIAHNHPSGNILPSKADINLTRRLKAACEQFEIELHDHVIITADDFYSMNEQGDI